MKRIILVLLGIIVVGSSSFAQDKVKFGLGWYSTSAPVGGRLWVSPFVGIDLGLGFADKNALGTDDSRVHVNLGFVFNAYKTGDVNFFIRPGLEYQTNARTVGTELKSKMIITADLGAEWFVTDHLSLSVGHGLQFEQVNDPKDDKWGITALRALSFNNVGFHFYF